VAAAVDRGVAVGLHNLELSGRLTVPDDASGVVLFVPDPNDAAHGASAPQLAHRFVDAGLGTLSVDLRAADERAQAIDGNAPDADLLAVRVLAVTRWLRAHPSTRDRSVAYFGSGAGAGAALLAAAEDPTVAALVVFGGRPDLVVSQLSAVRVPTLLLLVDGADVAVLAGNQNALRQLRCERALVIVRGSTDATHDLGAIDAVADASVDWFERHLVPQVRAEAPRRRGSQ